MRTKTTLLHLAIGMGLGAPLGAATFVIMDWWSHDVWTLRGVEAGLILGSLTGAIGGAWKGWELRGLWGAVYGGVSFGILLPMLFLSVV